MRKHFIFDFDGTLFDSMPYWGAGMIQVLKDHHIAYPDNIIEIITPLGNGASAVYFREELGLDMPVKEIVDAMNASCLPAYRDTIVLKEGAREYLQKLLSQGAQVHLLTASPHERVDVCMQRNGVYEWFTNVWTCEDFGLVKSNPEIYKQAARRLGATLEECEFYDDNIHSVQTAQKAGMFTTACYDASAEPFRHALQACADRYIHSFKELL